MEFQILDILTRYDCSRSVPQTVMRVFGRDAEGESVCCDVYGAEHYFFTKYWNNELSNKVNETKNK